MIHNFDSRPHEDRALPIPDFRSDIEKYAPSTSLYNNASPDHATVTNFASEVINTSGVELLLYHRTNNSDFNDTFEEDPHPTFWPAIIIKGFFKPQPSEVELTKFGVDNKNKAEIVFSKQQLLNIAGDRLVRSGDVIVPKIVTDIYKSSTYTVVTAIETGQFKYNWLYITCKCQLSHGDLAIIPR